MNKPPILKVIEGIVTDTLAALNRGNTGSPKVSIDYTEIDKATTLDISIEEDIIISFSFEMEVLVGVTTIKDEELAEESKSFSRSTSAENDELLVLVESLMDPVLEALEELGFEEAET